MEFLKEPVIEALNRAGRPQKAKELAKALGVERDAYRAFRTFLRGLEAAGELYRVKGGRFAPPDRINLVVGRLSLIRSGAAFLQTEKPGEEVFVPADELGDAWHGDKAVVRVERHRKGRQPEGRVVRVLERARTELVGTVHRGAHFFRVIPRDPKLPREILIPLPETQDAREGVIAMVELMEWGSAHSPPVGRITEILGMPGDPGLDVLVIIKHNGLPTAFPAEVEEAAAALPDEVPREEIAERLDLRDIPVVTIDPVTAKDFDDALSAVENEDGTVELGVHIADVSHYVRFGNALDREAWQRGTSVYLVDRVLPMLPEKLSNHLCSLNPGVDRLAMSVLMKVSPEGTVLDYRIEDTVIRSARRLTYEEVQGYFEGDPALRKALAPVASLLDRLRGMASTLNRIRDRRGALDFDLPESRVELDAEGLPVDIRKVVRLESHRLVEEFMLLANEVVARHLRRTKTPSLFRVHEEPGEKKLEELQEMLGRFGYSLHVDSGGRVPPRELQRVLQACEGTPQEQIVNMLVLRSLARARYDVHPLGHYGLALKDYSHFTSPIRRYPDLVTHRTLRILSGRQRPAMKETARYREWLVETALHSSERERVAEGAERDSVELKKIQFMERHVGEVFEGVITSVEVFGFFVELSRYYVSGLVHVSSLDDDYYDYLEDEFSLVGSSTGRTFTLGDPVRVRVLAVNKDVRQIDFLLDQEDEAVPEPGGKRLRRARGEFEGTAKAKRPPAGASRGDRRRRSSKARDDSRGRPGNSAKRRTSRRGRG